MSQSETEVCETVPSISYVNPCVKICTLETYACPFFKFLFFISPYHSPAERAVLGCQLGPACTSQGRGRHSQTQSESIQACNTVPFDSPHSSDFSQAWISGVKGEAEWEGRKNDKRLKYHKVSHKVRCKRQEKKQEWRKSSE